MAEKRVMRRKIAVAFGILSVSLAVALAFVGSEMWTLRNIVDMHESQIWLNQNQVTFESNGETDYDYSAGYAGYLTVVYGSASSGMYLEVSYDWAHPALPLVYSSRVNLTGDGSLTFPILPASVRIIVGNLADSRGQAMITAKYIY